MSIDKKVIFISDGDCEQGQQMSAYYASKGAAVIVNSLTKNGLYAPLTEGLTKSLTKNESSQQPKIYSVSADLLSRAEIDSAINIIAEKFGRIDALIHNNNEVLRTSIEACTVEHFDNCFGINAKSAFMLTQSAGLIMRKQKFGKIVYISSIHGEKPTGSSFLYSVSKGSLTMLVKEAASDLGRYNVSVNLIAAGILNGDCEKFESDLSPFYDSWREKIPSGKSGTYEDLSNLTEYIISDESSYLTGAEIKFDGGHTFSYVNRPNFDKDLQETLDSQTETEGRA